MNASIQRPNTKSMNISSLLISFMEFFMTTHDGTLLGQLKSRKNRTTAAIVNSRRGSHIRSDDTSYRMYKCRKICAFHRRSYSQFSNMTRIRLQADTIYSFVILKYNRIVRHTLGRLCILYFLNTCSVILARTQTGARTLTHGPRRRRTDHRTAQRTNTSTNMENMQYSYAFSRTITQFHRI